MLQSMPAGPHWQKGFLAGKEIVHAHTNILFDDLLAG